MKTILDPEYHARIIADIDNVCAIAGIQQRYLHESIVTVHLDTRAAWSRGNNFISKAELMVAVGGSATDNFDALATKREVNALLDDASERGKSSRPILSCYCEGLTALGRSIATPGLSSQTDCRSSSNCNQLQWSRRDLQRARTRKRIKLPIVLHYSLSTLAEQTTYGFIQIMIFQRTVAFSGD